jgi:ABC-2 type transport system ATP-binding protein
VALGSPEEVKRLMDGTILEIRSPSPRRASELLRDHFKRDAVGLFGDRVHLISLEPQEDTEKAEKILIAAGLSPASIRPVAPSLEDVFISLVATEKEGPGHGRS